MSSFQDIKTQATGGRTASRSDTESYLSRYSAQSRSMMKRNLNCQQWIEEFPEYYYRTCTQHFEMAQVTLASRRVAALVDVLKEKKADNDRKIANYAKHLTKTTKAVREEFFAKLILLIERKEDDSERAAILSFLAELCAIEYDGFGEAALKSFQELTESLLNIKAIVPDVIRHVFMDAKYIWTRKLGKLGNNAGVLIRMNKTHLAKVAPILVKLLNHPTIGTSIVQEITNVTEVRYPDEPKKSYKEPLFASQLYECYVECQGKLESKESHNPAEKERLRKQYEKICALISVCVTDPAHEDEQQGLMAHAMGKLDISKMMEIGRNERNLTSDKYFERAAELKMCSFIIKNQRDPRDRTLFNAAKNACEKNLEGLLEKFRQETGEENSDSSESAKQIYQAALIRCINAIFMRAEKCKGKLKGVGLNMNVNRFVQRFFKLAQTTGQHGSVVLATLETLNIFIHVPRMWEFRNIMEDQLAQKLQNIIKNLMQKKRTSVTKDDSEALIMCISIMRFYNEIYMQHENHISFVKAKQMKKISQLSKSLCEKGSGINSVAAKLNIGDVKGYDRELVLFNVLENCGNSPLFTSAVVLAAAKCLATVPLEQFEKQEIRRVVTALSQMAAAGIDNAYKVVTHILFLLARLAMAGNKVGDSPLVTRVADGFRKLYASEVVATCLDLCIKAATEVTGPNDVKYLDQDKRGFMSACVKFLMIAWKYTDIREGMTSEVAKTSLSRVLLVEQNLVLHATPEQLLRWKPIFLEQTWAGGDIGNLLHCVKVLGKSTGLRDIVAFRVIHQIANVLQGANLHDDKVIRKDGQSQKLVDELMKLSNDETGSFEIWDDCRNGTEIKVTKELETIELVDEENESARETIRPEDYKPETSDVWENLWSLMYRVMGGFLQGQPLNTDFRQTKEKVLTDLQACKNSSECVFLLRCGNEVKSNGGKAIESMVIGGKVRSETKQILDPDSIPELAGEMYYVFVHPDRSNDVKYVNELMSEFSHQMYLRKYTTCIALLHEEEVGMFSSDLIQKGDKMHPRFSRAKLSEIVKERGDQKDSKRDPISHSEGEFYLPYQKDIIRSCLRMWNLNVNIWQENTAHSDFLDLKGIETLTQFASKTQANDIPFSPTRDLLKSQQFGTELMLLLNNDKPTLDGPTLPESHLSFNQVLQRTFINPLMGGDMANDVDYADALKMILTDRNDTGTPAWNQFLVYSKEENTLSIQTMNPFQEPYAVKHQSVFRPNPHASEDYMFHRGPRKLFKPTGSGDMEAGRIPKDQVAMVDNLTYYKKATQKQATEKHLETQKSEKRASIIAEKQADKEEHLHAITAALIRAFYVLITKSSTRIREKTQEKLRVSKIIYPIIQTMKSFDYGIDRSVFKRSPYNYGAAMKFLVLTQELTDINARGHKLCLKAIEFYEILSQMVLDVMDKMKRLIASRDFDLKNFDPEASRRLGWFDEKMLCESTATIVELVREIASLNFFEGKKAPILRGNNHCRRAAIKNMFTNNSKLFDVIVSFLQYDTEVSVTGYAPIEGYLKQYNYREKATYRRKYLDQMRINCVTILAELLNFDEKFKYRFFRDYTTGSVKAVVGLRQSFILDVMKAAGWSKLRIELQGRMIAQGVFKGSGEEAEVIEELAVILVDGRYRLLVLTGERYFLSSSAIPDRLRFLTDSKVDNLRGDWDYFTRLEERSYKAIRGIYHADGDQMFATVTVTNVVEIFNHMELGVVDGLVNVFARYCRDDLDEPLTDRPRTDFVHSAEDAKLKKTDDEKGDTFFKKAQYYLLNNSSLQRVNSRMTRGTIICHTDARFGLANQTNPPRRVLIWVHCGQPEQYIIACSRNDSWKPTTNSEDGKPKDFYTDPSVYELKNIYAFEFSDSAQPRVTLKYKKNGYIDQYVIHFACDAAREIWRREVRKYIKSDKAWSSGPAPPKVLDIDEKNVRKFI
mmetsp:Transcript_39442/g.66123  ORF Transcript_39442/g.66123 Transcript_39442/m.66123 type:complete len:1933 (+) Transcript_39442:109-5907(+)